jgi:hypothetical protein
MKFSMIGKPASLHGPGTHSSSITPQRAVKKNGHRDELEGAGLALNYGNVTNTHT